MGTPARLSTRARVPKLRETMVFRPRWRVGLVVYCWNLGPFC